MDGLTVKPGIDSLLETSVKKDPFKGKILSPRDVIEMLPLEENDELAIFDRIHKFMCHKPSVLLIKTSGSVRFGTGFTVKLKYFIDEKNLENKLREKYPDFKWRIERNDSYKTNWNHYPSTQTLEYIRSLYTINLSKDPEISTEIDLT